MFHPKLAITIGDPHGIGAEVVLKSLASGPRDFRPVLVGPMNAWTYHANVLGLSNLSFNDSGAFNRAEPGAPVVVDTGDGAILEIALGEVSRRAGAVAMQAVDRAVELCMSGAVDGMVTAPISKEAVRRAGYEIPGHTEFIAERTNSDSFVMMMVAGGMRVALVTTHCAVRHVAGRITQEVLHDKLTVLETTLRQDFAVDHPSIAVLGLNPHAGDGGMIGREEQEVVHPVINRWNDRPSTVGGPFPADAFFGRQKYRTFDGVLAMYHDQGLIPFKTLHSDEGINFTGGLPIVRTSPDHGTAFDIAGKGEAVSDSMSEAVGLAIKVARRRAG
jgi:4-hydroxythreonine-4-phosphate dehydrogenase